MPTRRKLEKQAAKQRAAYARREKQRQDKFYLDEEREKEQVDRLISEIEDVQYDMVTFTTDGQAWIDIQDPSQRTHQQRIMSELMQRRMLYSCAAQLRGGLSAMKILTAVGMYMGMAAMSPQFRNMTNNLKAAGLGSVVNYLSEHPERKILGSNFVLNGLKNKRDSYLKAANDGRMPFTPETAAVADIRMAKEAYTQMRDGQHDPDEVMARYNDARETLYNMMSIDGVSKTDMARSQRVIIGKIMDRDPSYKSMFAEMGYDEWIKSAPHEERWVTFDENNVARQVKAHVWRGEYEKMDWQGNTVKIPDDTVFNVRKPMSDLEYAATVMGVMDEHDGVYTLSDEDSFNAARENMGRVFAYAHGDTSVTCSLDDPKAQEAFSRACNDLTVYRKLAHEDWANISSEDITQRERKCIVMGTNGALIKQTSAVLYADVYRHTQSPFTSIKGQNAADLSSLAVAFAEQMAGADTSSNVFAEKAKAMGDWYAMVTACVDADISTDLSREENRQAALEFMKSSPENQAKYDNVANAMYNAVNVYGACTSNMIAAGASKEDAISMLRYAENDGADVWAQVNGGYVKSNVEGLKQSREWAAQQMAHIDFSDIDTSYATNRYNERQAAYRAAAAESKFSGVSYGSYDGAEFV